MPIHQHVLGHWWDRVRLFLSRAGRRQGIFHVAKVWLAVLSAAAGLILLGNAARIHAKALLGQYLIRDAWQQTLDAVATDEPVQIKPWGWADTWPVARMQIPALGIDHIVLAGDSGQALAFGPGYHLSSAHPGEPGTALISGHRDTHFQFMAKLNTGHRILLQDRKGKIFQYRVSEKQVLDVRKAVLTSNYKEHELVLVTCWPLKGIFERTPYRYVIIAKLLVVDND